MISGCRESVVGKNIKVDKILNVRGLMCPSPAVLTIKALEGLGTGKILQVTADDTPSSRLAITALCEASGYELVALTEERGGICFFIRK